MFKLINPFVLAYNLQNDKGCKFTVESIRDDSDSKIRLMLRNVTNSSTYSVGLARVLDWKIVSSESNRMTVSDHIELCFKEAHKWFKSFNIDQLQPQDIEDVNFPQIPDCINRDELLHLKDKLEAERYPQKMLCQMLEEDHRLLRESYGSNNIGDRPLKVFTVKISGKLSYLNPIAHVQAAIRTANRTFATAPDVSNPDSIIESYTIAAIEEHCYTYIWESLQRTLWNRGSQSDIRMTFIVGMEPIGDAETTHIVFEKHSCGEVHIKIPCVSQKKLITVRVRSNADDLYKHLKREAMSKNSILADGIIRLKKSLDSLPRIGWLRFDSLNELEQWLDANLVTTNPDIASSWVAILRWLRSGYKNLPEKEHKTIEELINNKIKTFGSVPSI